MQVNIFISLYISRTTTVLLSKNHCTLTSLGILDFVQCYYLTNEWMMVVGSKILLPALQEQLSGRCGQNQLCCCFVSVK